MSAAVEQPKPVNESVGAKEVPTSEKQNILKRFVRKLRSLTKSVTGKKESKPVEEKKAETAEEVAEPTKTVETATKTSEPAPTEEAAPAPSAEETAAVVEREEAVETPAVVETVTEEPTAEEVVVTSEVKTEEAKA